MTLNKKEKELLIDILNYTPVVNLLEENEEIETLISIRNKLGLVRKYNKLPDEIRRYVE